MNKYQEALQNLYDKRVELIDVLSKNEKWAKNIQIYDFIGHQLMTLQELVDKEAPIKPYFLNYDGYKIGNWHCPECEGIINTSDMYCKHCGQRLDWSDVCE